MKLSAKLQLLIKNRKYFSPVARQERLFKPIFKSQIAGLRWGKSLCLIFLLQPCNNFIRRLWQNHQSRLFSSSLLVILSQAWAGFFAGSSACCRRLDSSLPKVRETPIYGCFGIGCPAVLVRCMLLYVICLERTTPVGRVDLVADLRVGLLLLSRAAAGQPGQPGLSSFTRWHTGYYGWQGQPDNLFGKQCFYRKKSGLPF